MVRRWVPLAVATAVLATAAGCGGDADPTSGAPDANLAGKTVEVAATWSGAEQANFQALLDVFAAKTGATVKYTSGGNDLPVLLNSRIAGGSPPDVALISQPGVVTEFVKRGAIKPLTGDAAAAIKENYSPAWQELGTVNGQLYGVYFKVANKSVMWYRVDSFADAGVQPPKTWDELKTVSTALADSGVTPMVAAGGDGWVLTDWFENIYLRVAGPEMYDKLAKHEIPWTDPSVVKTLTLLADYWRTPRFLAANPTQTAFTQAIADVFGKSPKGAMLFEGDFVASEINKLGELKVGESAKFFDWPSIDGSKPAVVTAGDQAVAFKDTPEANALMAFLASPEAAKIMAAKGGFISANSGLDLAAYPDGTTRQLAEAVVKAESLRFDLSDLTPQTFGGGTSAHLWVLLQDFLAKPIAPETLAKQLEAAAKKDFGGN
ncbi:ABC transporter substrate-binding protein [Micromonospora sp. NPDC002575]|uniref:ABC transporter substrate-binding protein n=1 Tax=Micromonospora sp. NPDC002575 TaxID=3364222 RepID=UPI00369B2749